jgi:hypothetical protein
MISLHMTIKYSNTGLFYESDLCCYDELLWYTKAQKQNYKLYVRIKRWTFLCIDVCIYMYHIRQMFIHDWIRL